MELPPGQDAPRALPIDFPASGSEYFRIWIVNLLLTVITLGLYLPFAKARRLRYFYANTLVDQQPLAFHGDPWRMFRGHVLVGGVTLAYVLLSKVAPLVGLAVFAALMLLWPALWRSSLIFRLRNTSWRGLRFDFNGSLGGAYKVFLPWLVFIAAIVALSAWFAGIYGETPEEQKAWMEANAGAFFTVMGLAYAVGLLLFAQLWTAIKRYQHAHYRFAGQQSQVDLSLGSVLGVGLKALGLFVLALLGFVLLIVGLAFLSAFGTTDRGAMTVFFGIVSVIAVYAALLFSFGPFVGARLQDLLWNATRSQHLQFSSRLKARSLGWLTLKNWLLILLTLGLYRPFAVVATTRLKLAAVGLTLDGEVEQWLADPAQRSNSAVGEMAGDFFGFDVGL